MKTALVALGGMISAVLAMHAPMLLGRGKSCPFGYDKAQPQVRLTSNEATPLLGFVLGRTTADEALRSGCAQKRSQFECVRGARTLWLTFAQDGRLAEIRSSWREPRLAPIRAAFEEAQRGLHAPARGDLALQQVLQQASVEAEQKGLRAVVRATNMGDGFLLTEDYRAL